MRSGAVKGETVLIRVLEKKYRPLCRSSSISVGVPGSNSRQSISKRTRLSDYSRDCNSSGGFTDLWHGLNALTGNKPWNLCSVVAHHIIHTGTANPRFEPLLFLVSHRPREGTMKWIGKLVTISSRTRRKTTNERESPSDALSAQEY